MTASPKDIFQSEYPRLAALFPAAVSHEVADDWLDRAADALERWELLAPADPAEATADAHEAAYDLLAAWSGLNRLFPALIGEQGRALVLRLNAVIEGSSGILADLARAVPDPNGWLQEGDAWSEEADDPLLDPATAGRRARELFTDLDDAQLVACALSRHCGSSEALESALLPCLRYMARNAPIFFPASRFIVEHARSFDPELCGRNPELWVTTAKFANLLEDLEEAELAVEALEVGGRGLLIELVGSVPRAAVADEGTQQDDPTLHAEERFLDTSGGGLRLRVGEVYHDIQRQLWAPVRPEHEGDTWLAISIRAREGRLPELEVVNEGEPVGYRILVTPRQVVLVVPAIDGSVYAIMIGGRLLERLHVRRSSRE